MRVAVLGAGGVGSYYGGLLRRAGHEVVLLARGANLAAVRARGLEVRTPEGPFGVRPEATDGPGAIGDVELAIVAVKTYSLDAIAPAARIAAQRGAVVLPLLNGVEACERLVAAGVPAAMVLGGLTQVSVVRVAPGVVERRSAFHRVVVGETAGGTSERAERVAAAFRAAGADAAVSPDITADLWRKLAFITPMAASCGMSRTPVGPVLAAPLGRVLVERAVREVLAVGRAAGVALAPGDEDAVLAFIESLSPELKPSFLLDLEAGGPTELDDLCGAVSRIGRRVGVETPVHDTATAVLSAATARR